jgi:ribonuclease P protein component
LGITTSKKIGNAVRRNRSRRVILAAYRALSAEIINADGCSIVFVARGRTASLKSTEIEVIMRQHLTKAGLIKETIN